MKVCALWRCEKPGNGGKGLCPMHYQRLKRNGDPTKFAEKKVRAFIACAVAGCPVAAKRRGWCEMHYGRWKRTGDPTRVLLRGGRPKNRTCSIDGCERKHTARGMCGMHYQRWRAHDDPFYRLYDSDPALASEKARYASSHRRAVA